MIAAIRDAVRRLAGRRAVRTLLAASAAVPAAFLIADALWPFPIEALRRPPAVVVAGRDGAPLRIFLPPDGRWRIPVRMDEVSPEMIRALVASEDRWFRWHPGVNPLAIARAAWSNVRAGRVVSGGSTIPMQLARLAEPKPRTIGSKALETFRALQLTWRFRKDDLLILWLNNAPCGGNLEGVGAAAWFYFGKTPAQLSLGEAALFTALPRSPAALDPAAHPEAAKAARDRVLDRLAALQVFPEREIADARRQPVPITRRRPPFAAPHVAQVALDRFPGEARIATTIDARVQRTAEEQVAGRIADLRRQGVGNAAVVVIENGSRAVRAMVGSAGFGEISFQGQVNGATARRSPGSALKPFLYAMAFDGGRIVPDSYLLDVPTDFSGYVAENYDGQYRGRVLARDALILSLNAPAVRLLSQAGLEPFVDLLHRGGLTTLDRPAGAYGLPLILGSGEVTLLDLTNLYATLADGGVHRPYRLRPGAPGPGERLFSSEAALLVAQILGDLRRPDLPSAWDLTRDVPAVAWKTGTSYGHRDAWAVGFSGRWTIGVWAGNLDGRGQKGISGADHAAPLLFDLFRSIEGGAGRLAEPPGPRLERAQVCALSHDLAGPFCPERARVVTLAGRTALPECAYHRRVFVDARSGEILAGSCLASRPHREKVVTIWPAELVAFWRSEGTAPPAAPRLSAACGDIPGEGAPQIVSPGATTPYRVRRDAPVRFQQIPLVARAAAGAGRLYWYRDGLLVASGEPEARLFLPPDPGIHRLVVVDDAGRTDAITYRVE